MTNKNDQWLKWISEIQAIAQSGLAFSDNPFDKERYVKLRALTAEMASQFSEKPLKAIEELFSLEAGYATPKVDVRAFILKEGKVLLVKERSDGLWTLPGGFADVNESPSEAVARETQEEAGYKVSVTRLLALWDKLKHDHPPRWPHVYKCFFHCEILSGKAKENIETSDLDFFEINLLPALSTHRVTEKQLQRLYKLVQEQKSTEFD